MLTEQEKAVIRLDISSLKKAINSGAQSVSYTDKSVTYKSHAEMMAALRRMEAELGEDATPNLPRRRAYRVISPADKGL